MTRIKICGIRDPETAHKAVEAGADLLGFVFAPSRRQISVSAARDIIHSLPVSVSSVGVFTDIPLGDMLAIAEYCGLDLIQLHSDRFDRSRDLIPYPIIRAVSMRIDAETDEPPMPTADFHLYDTYDPVLRGGTGIPFDWSLLEGRSDAHPHFVAGGLTPENVTDLIRRYRPYGVDVSSGVETDGIKDPEKIRKFIENVKEAEHALYTAG